MSLPAAALHWINSLGGITRSRTSARIFASVAVDFVHYAMISLWSASPK